MKPLTPPELSQEGKFAKSHLVQWLGEMGESRLSLLQAGSDNVLGERIARVEKSIKFQIEISNRAFEQSEKRFNQIQENMNRQFDKVDKRFEQINKRFEQVDKRFDLMQEDIYRRFDTVNESFKRVDRKFVWVYGLPGTTYMTMLAGFIAVLVKIFLG